MPRVEIDADEARIPLKTPLQKTQHRRLPLAPTRLKREDDGGGDLVGGEERVERVYNRYTVKDIVGVISNRLIGVNGKEWFYRLSAMRNVEASTHASE